jgi:hypothetical protein
MNNKLYVILFILFILLTFNINKRESYKKYNYFVYEKKYKLLNLGYTNNTYYIANILKNIFKINIINIEKKNINKLFNKNIIDLCLVYDNINYIYNKTILNTIFNICITNNIIIYSKTKNKKQINNNICFGIYNSELYIESKKIFDIIQLNYNNIICKTTKDIINKLKNKEIDYIFLNTIIQNKLINNIINESFIEYKVYNDLLSTNLLYELNIINKNIGELYNNINIQRFKNHITLIGKKTINPEYIYILNTYINKYKNKKIMFDNIYFRFPYLGTMTNINTLEYHKGTLKYNKEQKNIIYT